MFLLKTECTDPDDIRFDDTSFLSAVSNDEEFQGLCSLFEIEDYYHHFSGSESYEKCDYLPVDVSMTVIDENNGDPIGVLVKADSYRAPSSMWNSDTSGYAILRFAFAEEESATLNIDGSDTSNIYHTYRLIRKRIQ